MEPGRQNAMARRLSPRVDVFRDRFRPLGRYRLAIPCETSMRMVRQLRDRDLQTANTLLVARATANKRARASALRAFREVGKSKALITHNPPNRVPSTSCSPAAVDDCTIHRLGPPRSRCGRAVQPEVTVD